MDRYTLTNEGRARSRRRIISESAETARMEGNEILDFLYEHGAATIEELVEVTGMTRVHVMDKILLYMNHGIIEKLHG
jgi:predicted fused transcriptional regulator/phosphomethylpyrimidine kinase